MDWLYSSLHWYSAFFILGIVFFPLTKKIFGSFFPDQGYAISKTIALLLLSYATFLFGTLKILPFSQISLILLLAIYAFINYSLLKKKTAEKTEVKKTFNYQGLFLIIFEEILFLAALLFWAFVRGQEPSIRGLEKFMDFGFMNSILRSKYFPPLDMWYSADTNNPNGFSINYYYFGHLTGALLIKLTGIKASIGYNLVLASTFALTVIQSFSLVIGIIYQYQQKIKSVTTSVFETIKYVFFGLIGSYIVSLGGNLHTIYVFTKGYPNENPIPFWQIMAWKYDPTKYWYPNATRFIPNTIHEFPAYSWVVADLHGHVFDIPFVLLTLATLFIFFIKFQKAEIKEKIADKGTQLSIQLFNLKLKIEANLIPNYYLLATVFLGFMAAIHYMTNAFDGPIYILLILILLFFMHNFTAAFFKSALTVIISFVIFSLPFSLHFKPFVSGIGVNCSPEFLVKLGKLGPFLFEKGNCQVSPIYMLLVLWGFFWVNFILFSLTKRFQTTIDDHRSTIDLFVFTIFSFCTMLLIIPEFFYIKDIYPEHFRANTMFKLGYQAFIMMGIMSGFVFYKIKLLDKLKSTILTAVFIFFFFFIAIYPLYAIPSYYGQLDRSVELDGAKWFEDYFPEDKEIIDYINSNIKDQPIILEAQGDSYTDYERISAYTGTPTIAGWWVHEWLWRGTADVVGQRIPDIENIYQSDDLELTKDLLQKYKVSYVIISKMEKEKYPKLNQDKFKKIAKVIFETSNNEGALYQLNP